MSRGPGVGSIEFKLMLNQPSQLGGLGKAVLSPEPHLGPLPSAQESQPTDAGCGAGKRRVNCRHSEGSRKLLLGRPEVLGSAGGKGF